MKTIGLLGGSFDPVHEAHLALAELALRDLGLDALRLVPTGEPWYKAARLAPAADRLAMLELALGEPRWRDARVSVERCEIERPGPSYSVDTVEALRAREPGQRWVFVIGQDQHERLHTWHRWQDLAQLVTFAVAARPVSEAAAPRVLDPRVAALPVLTLRLPPMPVSSSAVRARAAAGLPLAGWVPPAVAGYIESHRLYRAPRSPAAPDRSPSSGS
jgi:nicotinate-nucleotide adenylyltransferase